MWLAIFGVVLAVIWAGFFGTLLMTGGLRTRDGFIIGRQKTPEQLDAMVARVKERDRRGD
jgi:hypothetical protein